MKKVIIIGSSRKDGETRKVVDQLSLLSDFDIIDLHDFNIRHYDYEHKNTQDDFLPLVQRIILNYDILIFATPVYWYSMSGIMKVFFDRITDLLDNEKELGRKLRNKKMAVLTSSVGDHLGDRFWFPFIATAGYLGMIYLGGIHTIPGQNHHTSLRQFVESIIKPPPLPDSLH